jgi:predicted small metal-binding protein
MARKYVDCRELPSESKCSVAVSADSEEELMQVAVQHAVSVHGEKDTPEFRRKLHEMVKTESPCA